MKRLALLTVVLLAAAEPVRAQHFAPLLDRELRDLLHDELSGEWAKDHVIQISRHHRIQGSRGYRHSANYVLERLRSYGFADEDAYIESYPSDGRIEYQTWQSPSGWDIERAELRMVEPYEERIVGYPEVAMSLITYSNPGSVTAELVWVGQGTSDADYTGKDVAGKFILATGYGGEVHRYGVLKYGAAAVVAYLDDDRAKQYPDMLQYTGMWPRAHELDDVTFGFNITNRQGERLRTMLESGRRVVVRGEVSGIGLEPYYMDVVVARIPGGNRADETLVIVGHLDHPKESANDNASGSAAMLDMARSIRELIDGGRLPQPQRSLLFLWVPEWNGTMAYIDAHAEMTGPRFGGKYLASINLDMVGENLELLHSRMNLTSVPWSIPSVLTDVVANVAEMVSRMNIRTPRGSLSELNYKVTPYSGGSDHMMFIDRKVPAVMLGHSDYTHHTSEDTPDKVDPVELERSELIAAATMLYLSDLSTQQAVDLTYLAGANGARRLGAAARRANSLMATVPSPIADAWDEVRNIVSHAAEWQREVVSSVLHFNDDRLVRTAVASMQEQLSQQEEQLLRALEDRARVTGVAVTVRGTAADQRIPARKTRGPLDFGLPESQLSEGEVQWYSSAEFDLTGTERFELVNLVDGVRSVSSIRNALSAEFRPIPLSVVAHYLEDLVEVGVVAWRQ